MAGHSFAGDFLLAENALYLCGVLGQFGQVLAVRIRGCDDFHFPPVIGKLSAAIETSYIGSGQSGGWGAAPSFANSNRKAVAGVPATK